MQSRKVTGEENIFFMTPEANVAIVARIKGPVNESDLKNCNRKSCSKVSYDAR